MELSDTAPDSSVETAPVIDFSLVTPESVFDPFPLVERARQAGPVVRCPAMGGVLLVSSHQLCRAVLTDPGHFSSTVFASTAFGPWFEGTHTMVHTDPPDHTRLRGLVQRVFTHRSVQRLEPRIEEIVADLLDAPGFRDRMAAGEPVDLLAEFTSAVPTTVIAELLGIPGTDRKLFYDWSEAMMRCIVADPNLVPQEHIDAAVIAGKAMLAYLEDQIRHRRSSGAEADDLISQLVRANDDGTLSDEELAATCVLMLTAGSDTTSSTMTTMVSLLDEHRDQRQRLLADPGLIPSGIEETLRFQPTARVNFRKVLGGARLGDAVLEDGDVVWVLVLAANRDPERFADPLRYDVGRSPNPHLTFGSGPHLCLGAALARLEMRHAVGGFLSRWPDYQVVSRDPSPAYAALTWESLRVADGA